VQQQGHTKKEERQEAAVKRKAISDDKAWEKAILVEERQMEKISRKNKWALYFLCVIRMKIIRVFLEFNKQI
jgi:hypothetical protein